MNWLLKGWLGFALLAVACWGLLSGCATNRVDWASRIGTYTYDQALVDFGPPDKTAQLSDGRTVAEWLTRHGYSYVSGPVAYGYYYPYAYAPFYPFAFNTINSPNYYLRLVFSPEGTLTQWKKFTK